MDIFQVMGPVMVGPSSSHTAGAAKIGFLAAKLLGEEPVGAKITLYGSFAATGAGHGTDRALVGGLLGMRPDDLRIPTSFEEAGRTGLSISFEKRRSGVSAHPNTVRIDVEGKYGGTLSLRACSAGGGRVVVEELNGMETGFGGERPTLVLWHTDTPGSVARAAGCLSGKGINIASISLSRKGRGGEAVLVIETDGPVPEKTLKKLRDMKGVRQAAYYQGD